MSNNGTDTNPMALKDWMLLDSQSTVNIFCNEQLLSNIHYVQDGINLHANGERLSVNWQGHLNNYGCVWFDIRAIMNILCLNNARNKFKITYDSETNYVFHVHKNGQ